MEAKNENFKDTVNVYGPIQVFLGIVLSLGFFFLVVYISSIVHNFYPTLISLIILPILGYYQKKGKHRKIGLGILIGYAIIFALSFLILMVMRNLH